MNNTYLVGLNVKSSSRRIFTMFPILNAVPSVTKFIHYQPYPLLLLYIHPYSLASNTTIN